MHICPQEFVVIGVAVPFLALAPLYARRAWSFVCRCCARKVRS